MKALERAQAVARHFGDPIPEVPDRVSIALEEVEHGNYARIEAIGNEAVRQQKKNREDDEQFRLSLAKKVLRPLGRPIEICGEVHTVFNVRCRRREKLHKGKQHKWWNSSTKETVEWI